ncbi:MAG: VOC family protein [Gemmatimonadota bacterium]
MDRVTGIGGIFLKARDPDALRAWYRDHLGIPIDTWGGATFRWRDGMKEGEDGLTVWSVFPDSSKYFDPSKSQFMVNYRVEDLHKVLGELRAEGCAVDEKSEESEFGKFGWVMDPEGNKIELWEPPPGKFPG